MKNERNKEEDIFQNIQQAFENLPDNFSILEEQIEIELQMKYFDFARKVRKKDNVEECFEQREELFLPDMGEERKREILSALATIDDAKAFRTIEKFVESSEGEIRQWAVLALQESRMLLQTSLLEEQQVLISTGLGGKGKSLRYFVVFIHRVHNEMPDDTQQKILHDEMVFSLKQNNGDLESMDFKEGFTSALVLLPLQIEIQQFFNDIIDECNQYGNFLEEDVLVTNVKILSGSEILQAIHQFKNNLTEKNDGKQN
ncbi:MAG: hypothetical protein CSA36_05670 [Draconibacterium sp.]|nr:MAG: hypothetical protein CSA36_05670 [Draconibacterium sp.]